MQNKDAMARFVVDAFDLLERQKFYQQADVLAKLRALGQGISASSLSNILGDKGAGIKTLLKAQKGLKEIIALELGQTYDAATATFVPIPQWEAEIIDPHRQAEDSSPPFRLHEHGRLTIQEKVRRMNLAQKEVVEFGVRLRTFTDYFQSRSAHEFSGHVEALLQRGVHFKLYFVDPDSNEARIYFADRAEHLPAETESVEVIRKVKERLLVIQQELNARGYPGRLEVYTYKHIPGAHYLLIDGSSRQGKLLVSHYLFATKRADSPSLEINKQDNPELYRKYYRAIRALRQGAKPIT